MLAKLGFLAVVILVGSESFVVTAAVLWPAAALAHLGSTFQIAAVMVAAIIGIVAGLWIGWRAFQQERTLVAAEASE